AGDLPVSTAFPRLAAHPSDRLLYEQLFDLKDIFGVQVPATGELNQATDFYHYSLDTTLGNNPPVIDPKTPLVLAGLGIRAPPLWLPSARPRARLPVPATGHCTLDRPSLSLLYRHVLAARALGLTIPELVAALDLNFAPADRPLTDLAQIEALVRF